MCDITKKTTRQILSVLPNPIFNVHTESFWCRDQDPNHMKKSLLCSHLEQLNHFKLDWYLLTVLVVIISDRSYSRRFMAEILPIRRKTRYN